MDRLEAQRLLESKSDRMRRPKSDTPDYRPAEEQIMDLTMVRFERRLARQAMSFERRFGHWPKYEWFSKHRTSFLKHATRREKNSGPPCKHWRGKVPVFLLEQMEKTWSVSLRGWAMKHPYLASPTAKCECYGCSAEPVTIENYDWSQPLEM